MEKELTIKAHRLFRGRKSGVLLHITSLPEGDLGPWAYRFVDWLADAGQTFWQVLPVGPTGNGNSPYSALSAFAGEPSFVSTTVLANEGLKGSTAQAAKTFFKQTSKAFQKFCQLQSSWLDDWCEHVKGNKDTLAFVQFKFAQQWHSLRKYASSKGIRLIGDIPIFVGAESVDVVSNPELFRLHRNGNPVVVTGVPPDCYSKDGQRWGHPHYNWVAHEKNSFQWWCHRLRVHLSRFDLVRIDHFIGLYHAFEISNRAKTARKGVWKRAPGRALLQSMFEEFGNLPLIAEDLGRLTKPVEQLRDDFCLPGVRITQEAIWGEDPMQYPSHCIAYSGTHDTDTALGWWRGLSKNEQHKARIQLGAGPLHETLVRATLQSPACISIIPMQDILGLGSEARMNRPGTIRGNWKWKMNKRSLTKTKARWLREMTRCANRCN